jgi:hypothetical protein
MCILYYSCFQIIFILFYHITIFILCILALWLFELLIRVPIQLVFFPLDSAPFSFRICDQIYPFPNPHLIIIRSTLNPPKKHGRWYGKDKIWSDPIRSNPFTSLLPWDKWLVFHSSCLLSMPQPSFLDPPCPSTISFLVVFSIRHDPSPKKYPMSLLRLRVFTWRST